MKRIHLFEIEDQSWCPENIRQAMTEFLVTVTRMTKLWQPTGPILNDLLRRTSQRRLLVLGAGAGGGILDVVSELPQETEIILTDLFPHQPFQSPDPRIKYFSKPVNAASVPKDLAGVRVMYAMFHHLRPELAKKVLENAVSARQAIAVFEGTERSIKGILGILLVPLLVLLLTPLIRPFRWERLFLTYLLPVLPLAIFWDGLVSCLRTYDAEEMKMLVADFASYKWDIAVLKGPHGERIPSLIGIPKE